MEQFIEMLKQIQELSGVMLDALESGPDGKGKGGPPEGGPPDGPPPGGPGGPPEKPGAPQPPG